MQRPFYLLVCVVCALVTPVPALSASASDVKAEATLVALQKRASQGQDMAADFTQSYHDTMRAQVRQESGRLEVKRDGRLRFRYMQPIRKEFIFAARTAYFYEPEAGQVTLFDHFAGSVAAKSLQIIWGQGEIGKLFRPESCRGLCPTAGEQAAVLQLTPIEPLPTVSRVALVIEKGDVTQACVYDPLGNVTDYRFTHIDHKTALAGGNFRFRIPKGISVLHGPSGDGAPAPQRPSPVDIPAKAPTRELPED